MSGHDDRYSRTPLQEKKAPYQRLETGVGDFLAAREVDEPELGAALGDHYHALVPEIAALR